MPFTSTAKRFPAVPRSSIGQSRSTDRETDWKGYHSLAELPQLTNPRTGFLESSNSSPFLVTTADNPVPADYPAYLVGADISMTPARNGRELLAGKGCREKLPQLCQCHPVSRMGGLYFLHVLAVQFSENHRHIPKTAALQLQRLCPNAEENYRWLTVCYARKQRMRD